MLLCMPANGIMHACHYLSFDLKLLVYLHQKEGDEEGEDEEKERRESMCRHSMNGQHPSLFVCDQQQIFPETTAAAL